MTAAVYAAFDEILRAERARGPVLEIGAANAATALLHLPALADVADRTALDLAPGDLGAGVRVIVGNANQMTAFGDASFETILCNATLEHDPRFWLTLAEIRRVARPDALIAIGVPGYAGMGPRAYAPHSRFAARLLRGVALATRFTPIAVGTPTLGEHRYPGDYYRFSEQAVREVFLDGLAHPCTRIVMNPPRILGWGRR
jgi:SAM-dependent methyltransferase